ncbi:hypothetical protein N7497_009214 [Penicillium chrysogenum]|nr:hypothetical protein N7497_009214 [Penicillium chrysogenum]
MITVLSAFSAAPYAAGLGLFLLGYFFVIPYIEYLRDPKGLRRYPNLTPFSGFSAVPFMIMASRGFRSMELSELHKKNPVIRTGPNQLSYGDVRAIKDIYGHNTKCLKDPSYVVTSGTHYNLADVVDKPDHARKRKILSAAYALKNLETWEYKVTDKVQRMFKHFDKVCTTPASAEVASGKTAPDQKDLTLDLRAWTNFFTLDAIADIGLSEKLGFLDSGTDLCIAERKDGSTYETNLREALYPTARKQSLIVWNYEWYPIVNKLVNIIPFFGRMQTSADNWENIMWRRATKGYDVMKPALMEDKNGNAKNLEWGEVVAECNIMMNAGSVTTAVAIANVISARSLTRFWTKTRLWLITTKLSIFPTSEHAWMNRYESSPPTSHGLPRETPAEGTNILGEWVAAHRDESVFPNADQYIPERWLGEEGKALQPYLIAFSAGARSCIGRNISYLEQTKAVASMVHRYDFALSYPGWELKRLETMNLILGEMPVKIWRRDLGAGEA